MAVSQFKVYVSGEVLTASDLNSSLSNITDNGEDLGWPATKAKDLNGNELILDADADTSIAADTDDQIDVKISGADDFQFTANTFTAHAGSKIVSDDTTDSTSGTTGSIQTDGGIGAVKDIVTDATFKPLGDTAAGDAAALGRTATEGLVLTGQGSTSDVTLKNDTDTTVLAVPTGTDDIAIPATGRIYLDGVAGTGNTYLFEAGADAIRFVIGGNNSFEGRNNGFGVNATDRIFLDGNGDTYIHEPGANIVRMTIGGNAVFEGRTNGIGVNPTDNIFVDGNGDTFIEENSANVLRVIAGGSGGVDLLSGGTSWTAVSDERYKVIIEPISDALNKVSSLRSVIGSYKTKDRTHHQNQVDGFGENEISKFEDVKVSEFSMEGKTENKRRSFLIAQDVQKVLPEAVTVKDDEHGTLSLSYTDVIPLLVAAIKELKVEVDALKAMKSA